jgi:aryl-alcohol dehydrogenase-like predicted oxidoreductase
MATTEDTFAYRGRFGSAFARTFFRRAGAGVVSSVGLGAPCAGGGDRRDALLVGLENGVNLVDTAIHARGQRDERAVGAAIEEAAVERGEVYLTDKAGTVPFDGERPENPGAFVRREYVETGLVEPEELVGSHCIAPAFLDDQIARSLSNLGVDTIDCYFLHTPEVVLDERPREDVYDAVGRAFEAFERRVAAGDIANYGVTTWEALRVPADHPRYLSLAELVRRARAAAERAGNDSTSFRAVQLPFNVEMAGAFTVEAQEGSEGTQSALEFVHGAGLDAFATAPLAGGDLLGGLPPQVAAELAGDTSAQRALNFARSAPGVVAALVGTDDRGHVRENVAAGTFEPLGADAFDAVFT